MPRRLKEGMKYEKFLLCDIQITSNSFNNKTIILVEYSAREFQMNLKNLTL